MNNIPTPHISAKAGDFAETPFLCPAIPSGQSSLQKLI